MTTLFLTGKKIYIYIVGGNSPIIIDAYVHIPRINFYFELKLKCLLTKEKENDVSKRAKRCEIRLGRKYHEMRS